MLTLELLAEGRTEFLKGHMVWIDKAICCSASRRRKVAGVGRHVQGEGGVAENSFRWGVEGVDILGCHC